MRADRLLSLALLLQARGAATARALADELGVSVRTVYRDLEALSAAGVPVVTEAGPGGGCRVMDGYRFPLRGLRPDEAEALLILGVPAVLRELGLAGALTAAHRQIQVTAGVGSGSLVHLDMPRWFGGQEEVPCLRDLAQALRLGRKLAIRYPPPDREPRVVGPPCTGWPDSVIRSRSWTRPRSGPSCWPPRARSSAATSPAADAHFGARLAAGRHRSRFPPAGHLRVTPETAAAS